MIEREFWVEREGKRIYSLIRTEGEDKRPALILSHGYGGDSRGEEGFARYFAERGFLTCALDFSGGGRGSRSDGETWEMSPLTEVRDLSAVINGIKNLPWADSGKIFLLGESQAVSGLCFAGRQQKACAGPRPPPGADGGHGADARTGLSPGRPVL